MCVRLCVCIFYSTKCLFNNNTWKCIDRSVPNDRKLRERKRVSTKLKVEMGCLSLNHHMKYTYITTKKNFDLKTIFRK